jgi:Sec-independent protein translocase protein TatA
MLDFGWSEFFLIIILAIVLMGLKDIPEVIHNFGRIVRRLQYMKFALTKQFDDFMEKADLQDLRRGTLGDIDPKNIMTPLPLASAEDLNKSPAALEDKINQSLTTHETAENSKERAVMPYDPEGDDDENYYSESEVLTSHDPVIDPRSRTKTE